MFFSRKLVPGPDTSFKFSVRRVQVNEILELRHRILRKGLPISTARFPADEDLRTWHVAVYLERIGNQAVDQYVCCASFMFEPFSQRVAWQLRGMATETACQGQGWGKTLLLWAMEQIVIKEYVRLFWCNARAPAAGFYQKLGWEVCSDEFSIPTVGPHYQMRKIWTSRDSDRI